jgi:flagellar basal-body rod protein FlgC
MGLFTGMDASASALTAQRLRLDIIANNIANATSTRSSWTTAAGNPVPYQRQLAVFQPKDAHPNFAAYMHGMTSPGRGVSVARHTPVSADPYLSSQVNSWRQNALGGWMASSANGYITSGDGITSSTGLGAGVKVSQIIRDPKPFKLVYEPDSPDAAQVEELGIPVGYVRYPNVEIVEEMLDMISATRAYEANVTAMNASKTMASRALDIGR